MTAVPLRSPLRHLDLEAINESARQETRSRESVLPPVSVFRWWARRTSAVNGGVIDAVHQDMDRRLLIADPFAGGGVIPLTALASGDRVYAQDIDPWAAHGIHSMLTLPDSDEIGELAADLRDRVSGLLAKAYEQSGSSGSSQIIHTIRVATSVCQGCDESYRLFPYAMVTRLQRRERGGSEAYLACRAGHLFKGSHAFRQRCPTCREETNPSDSYMDGRNVECPNCRRRIKLAAALNEQGAWEVALVERLTGGSRLIDTPTKEEVDQADKGWHPEMTLGSIPAGRETRVLLRHGFTNWDDLYPARQLVVMERLLKELAELRSSETTKHALRMAIVGSAEMAGYASRWDRWYLKSYETMARNRFTVTTLAVEPNVWGVKGYGRGTVQRRVKAFVRASDWLAEKGIRSDRIDRLSTSNGRRSLGLGPHIDARVVQGSSTRILLPSGTADLILTDPPYHDDIQYTELSSLLRVWAGLPSGPIEGSVVARGLGESQQYEDLLHSVFAECRRVLRSGAHMILTFANRELSAWLALIKALDRAGFRGCGFAVVHGENETDFAKQNGRHYKHNLLIDVVKADAGVPISSSKPKPQPQLDGEVGFLHAVGRTTLDIGDLKPAWTRGLTETYRSNDFLSSG